MKKVTPLEDLPIAALRCGATSKRLWRRAASVCLTAIRSRPIWSAVVTNSQAKENFCSNPNKTCASAACQVQTKLTRVALTFSEPDGSAFVRDKDFHRSLIE